MVAESLSRAASEQNFLLPELLNFGCAYAEHAAENLFVVLCEDRRGLYSLQGIDNSAPKRDRYYD